MRKKMTQMKRSMKQSMNRGTKKPTRKSMRKPARKPVRKPKRKSTKNKSEWQKLVMEVYNDMKKQDPSFMLKDAYPIASKMYKKQSK